MNKGDQLVDRAADRLRAFADRAATEGGVAAKLAEPLADDAAFLRKLKPSLIKARVKGEAPTNLPAGSPDPLVETRPLTPPSPKKRGKGPNPYLVVGGALVIGIALAKLIDWRGHAHPRD
jgi:hypothetical protein